MLDVVQRNEDVDLLDMATGLMEAPATAALLRLESANYTAPQVRPRCTAQDAQEHQGARIERRQGTVKLPASVHRADVHGMESIDGCRSCKTCAHALEFMRAAGGPNPVKPMRTNKVTMQAHLKHHCNVDTLN